MVQQYNSKMGGVDKYDQQKAAYQFKHKNRKWYMVLFYGAIDTALHNSKILYRKDREAAGQKPISSQQYREKLVEELLARQEQTVQPRPGR